VSVAKSSSAEAAEGKPVVGSKRETRSRRAEILHALGKSTTESDVTEGCNQFCLFMYYCSYSLSCCCSTSADVESSLLTFVFGLSHSVYWT